MELSRAIIAVAMLFVSFAAQAERRVALVIGNSAYENVAALANPVRDAKAVAKALRDAGFVEVKEGYDLTKPKFDAALKSFGDTASGADWALIYYAGHGIGIGGETYTLPVDAVLQRAEHADDEAVSLSRLRAKASGAKTLRMVILDSCRNNPFAARLAREAGAKRAISRGLPAPTLLEGDELIAYATRENDVADDGEGQHSPFTTAFLLHMQEPGLEVRFLFGKVRDSVQKATGRAQTPATYGDLGGAYFYFRPPEADAAAPLPEGAEAWRICRDTCNETELEAFIKRFGETVYGDFARTRLNEINRKNIAIVKQYEDPGHRLVRSFINHIGGMGPVAFSPDGRFAFSSSCGETNGLGSFCSKESVRVWEAASGKEVRAFTGHNGTVNSLAFSPDGRFALSGSCDETNRWSTCTKGSVKLWEVATGEELRNFTGHTGAVNSVAFSPDGSLALSGSCDETKRGWLRSKCTKGSVKLWEVASGKELRSFTGHASAVDSVAFSPDGRFALSSSCDETILILSGLCLTVSVRAWEVESGKELLSFTGPYSIFSPAFSPDSHFLLSGGCDEMQDNACVKSSLKLWDVASGKELHNFIGPYSISFSPAFSPDGRFLLSGGCDEQTNNACIKSSLKLWEVASGKELRSFAGHTGFVSTAAFSPDGRFVLSGGCDETKDKACVKGALKLWDVASGKELNSSTGHTSSVLSVAFSPDGQFALSGSLPDGRLALLGIEDKTLKLWDVSEWTQPQEARR